MASNLSKVSLLFKKVTHNPYSKLIGSVRHVGKNKPGNTTIPKRYGIWVGDGATVTSGTVVARQYRLRFCAGLNVGISDGYLYAKVPGRVVITSETTNFDPENKRVQKLSPNNTVMQMIYFNVIPNPQHCRFKLIEQN